MSRPKAILFDLDNTLYDFTATWTQATYPLVQELIEAHHKEEIPVPELWGIFERINRVIFSHVDHGHLPGRLGRQLRWELLGAVLNIPIDPHEMNSRHLDAMMFCIPFEETSLVIPTLAQSYPLGIVTNGPEDLLNRRLTAIGLDSYFPAQCRISAERAGFFKPHPEIFQKALTALGVAPQDALYIGDSWEYDVLGAYNAHIPCLWFNPYHRPCPTPQMVLQEIHTLSDLLHSQWIPLP
ncbi:putative hydrolase of the HAD superfamily [Sulfobacillus thermosulfidooxidans DSM 9293]|uniref:Putative hydrolase of the HAD superfamily n=1 Tax=Sulfobacillus thermosulfidooxidans (strain DSM 9293 / VKM B-1269 / AT-1) TaxID=929705 RepID=A0A1W1W8C8_SULTA|nr:HAD family hydrolase [Sulfobacillus thermosulfidooxidans]SMC02544.1 putative hydrolase of the HAD superfamily [Sulfobacillus thermosulfidooxidans DSM 9293]